MKQQAAQLTIEESARLMQTTPLHILMHIKRGLLRGREQDGVWLIERASLEERLEHTGGGRAVGVCAQGCVKKTSCAGGCG